MIKGKMAEGGSWGDYSHVAPGSAAASYADVDYNREADAFQYSNLPFRNVMRGDEHHMNRLLKYLDQLSNHIKNQAALERPSKFSKGSLIGVILCKDLSIDEEGYKEGHHYDEMESMGRGGYGNVYACRDRRSSFNFVAKKIPISKFSSREVAIPLQLAGKQEESRFILDVYGVVFKDGEFVDIFLQKAVCTWNDLLSQKWTYMDLIFWLHQTLTALKYLDDNGIIHMDIKPQNLGILDDGNIVLLDYGSCVKREEGSYTTGITARYTPPEVWRRICTNKADVYSLACSILFLLNGKHVLSDELDDPRNEGNKCCKMTNEKYTAIYMYIPDVCPAKFDSHLFKFLRDLIKKMIDVSVERRTCAGRALRHQLFHEWKRAKEMSQTHSSAAATNEEDMEAISSASSSSTFEFLGSLNSAGSSLAGRPVQDVIYQRDSSSPHPPQGGSGDGAVESTDLQGLTAVLADIEVNMDISQE